MNKKLAATLLVMTMLFAASCNPVTTTEILTSEGVTDPSSISTTNEPEESAVPEESTVTKVAATTATPTGDPMMEGMMFPDSDERLIMWEELVPLGPEALALARNDFFAREGYVFQKQMYIDHYSPLAWYEPDESFSYDQFNEIQRANILLIQVAEARSGNGLLYIPSGTTLDFDQDGVLEELTYDAPDDNTMNIVLHDTDDDYNWNIDYDSPHNEVFLGDISYEDGILDLFTDFDGASSDFESYIAGVTENGFLERGVVAGICDDIRMTGDGSLTASTSMWVMMSWFAPVKHTLGADGKLVKVPEPEYFFGEFPCTTIIDVPMRSAPDASMASDLTIPAGSAVTLISSDNIEWVKIRWGDQEGWLHLDGFKVTDLDKYSYTVFEGLIIGD